MTLPSRFHVFGLAAVLAGIAPAQETTSGTDNAFVQALPESTMLYASFPDFATSIEEFQQMPLARMWREEEVQDFFGRALAMAEEYRAEGMSEVRTAHEQGQFPFDPDELVKARLRSLSLAVTSMELQALADMPAPMPRFGFLLHADFGDTAPIWHDVLRTGLGMLQAKSGDDVTTSVSEVAGTSVTTLKPADIPVDMGLNIAFVGNGVLIGTLIEDVSGVLHRLSSGAAGLTATADFQAMTQHVQFAGAESEFFMRPNAFLDFGLDSLRTAQQFGSDIPPIDIDGIDRALTALGLRSVDALATTSRYVDGTGVTDSFVLAPAAQRKGLLAGHTSDLDFDFLRLVPKDATSFTAMKFDMSTVYDTLTAALQAYDENLAKVAMGHLGMMEEQFGLSLEEDLFGAFGDEFLLWAMPMAALTGPQEMGILIAVNDQDKVLKSLQTIVDNSQGYLRLKKSRRGTWQLRVEIDTGGGMAGMGMNPFDMFVPNFTFQDGYMVMGFTSSDVKRALGRMEREDDPSGDIRSNPDFAPFLDQIPESGISSLSFTDWKSSFESMYSILASLTMFMPMNENIPFEPELLPEASTLTQHLHGGATWGRVTESGFGGRSRGPFGPEIGLALAGALGAGAATFFATEGRDAMPIKIR